MTSTPAYWLQNISIAEVATAPHDLVVVDRDIGAGGGIVSAAEVAAMQGSDGARTILGYMSTGEAEDYRSYWQSGWDGTPPAWLGPENPDWGGNYLTAFWSQGWRDVLFGRPGAYLDSLIAAGFDGAWLDVVDVYQTSWVRAQNADAKAAMIDLIEDISAYAKAIDPGFRIYLNIGGAEELLADAGLLAAIDGVYKEELYYAGERKNSAGEVSYATALLDRAVAAGKDVGLVEYIESEAQVLDAQARAAAKGYALYVADPDTELASLDQHGTAGADRLAGGAGPNMLLGLAGADTLTGGGGADRLNGGSGADRMSGDAGNDTYIVDNAGDRAIESAATGGTDTVKAAVSFALGANLEHLVLTGSAAINGTGNALANRITGNAAANRLDGGAGADTLTGGGGNDTYVVDGAGDRVVEKSGGGRDTVLAAVTHTLAAEVEDLTLTGSAAINGTGNALANRIGGQGAANQLAGLGGADTLAGGGGADTLTGGSGADSFLFGNPAEGRDRIADFSVAQGDRVVLVGSGFGGLAAGPLSAGAFATGAAADAGDRLVFDPVAQTLAYDADGSGAGAPVVFAVLNVATLSAANILVA